MPHRRILILARMDPPEGREAEWNNWYNNKHVADRLKILGFLFIRRFVRVDPDPQHFVAKGEGKYMTMYELANAGVMETEPYLKLREMEAALPPTSFEAISRNLPSLRRGVYEQVFPLEESTLPENPKGRVPRARPVGECSFAHQTSSEARGRPSTLDSARGYLHSKFVIITGDDVSQHVEKEYGIWQDTERIPAVLRVPGFINARRFVLTKGPHTPAGTVDVPKYVTVYDLENETALDSEVFKREAQTPGANWAGPHLTSKLQMLFRRIYPED